MNDFSKYQGVIPAFYACYDEEGDVSPDGVRALARYLLDKGVKGLYVGGSSGECIYQSVAERKLVLENVMAEVGGKLTVIAHVACNNTADSRELAAHAESLGVDAIAAIPPIYFHLPEKAIAQYWNDISAAAPNTDFIIYNIPQLAGVALTLPLLEEMLKNPRVIGVKNSSMPVQDIQHVPRARAPWCSTVPTSSSSPAWLAGAIGGIGGTYAAMPELFLKVRDVLPGGRHGAGPRDPERVLPHHLQDVLRPRQHVRRDQGHPAKQGAPDCGARAPAPGRPDRGRPGRGGRGAAMIAAAIAKYC